MFSHSHLFIAFIVRLKLIKKNTKKITYSFQYRPTILLCSLYSEHRTQYKTVGVNAPSMFPSVQYVGLFHWAVHFWLVLEVFCHCLWLSSNPRNFSHAWSCRPWLHKLFFVFYEKFCWLLEFACLPAWSHHMDSIISPLQRYRTKLKP